MSAAGESVEFELRVEPAKVRELALAVGDRNPLIHDPEAARRAGLSGPIAPPTYPMLAAWEVDREQLQPLRRIEYDRALQAEQSFSYERPLLVGESLRGSCRLAGDRHRQGRSGGMSFVTYRTAYRDAAGEQVAVCDYTLVELDGARPDPAEQAARPEPEPPPLDHVLERGPIGRVDLARYAGASGDFEVMHLDDEAARAAGEPSVFAAGMMLAGYLASAACEWAGEGAALRSFAVRMVARAWPGDTVRCEGRESEPGRFELRLRRRAAGGDRWQTAILGSAVAFPPGGGDG